MPQQAIVFIRSHSNYILAGLGLLASILLVRAVFFRERLSEGDRKRRQFLKKHAESIGGRLYIARGRCDSVLFSRKGFDILFCERFPGEDQPGLPFLDVQVALGRANEEKGLLFELSPTPEYRPMLNGPDSDPDEGTAVLAADCPAHPLRRIEGLQHLRFGDPSFDSRFTVTGTSRATLYEIFTPSARASTTRLYQLFGRNIGVRGAPTLCRFCFYPGDLFILLDRKSLRIRKLIPLPVTTRLEVFHQALIPVLDKILGVFE